jgi:CRP-like cAMP-binding protein
MGGQMENSIEKGFLNCYLFDGLTGEEKNEAYSLLHVHVEEYRNGEVLFSPSIFTPTLVYVLSGSATVKQECEGRQVLLNILKEGDTFGAASLFSDRRSYPTTVRAKGTLKVAVVQEEALQELFLRYPQSALSHIRFLSDRVRFLNDRIDSLSGRDVESKVSKFLLSAYGKPTLHSNLNMRQVAASLDIGRASLYRLLKKFEERQIITFTNGDITILNIKELERLAKKS